MRTHERVALVTGAAHRVGKAIARALAERGAHVAVHYGRSAARAEETAAELAREGVDAATFGADLESPEAIDRLVTEVADRFGRLDILVNSAASFVSQEFETIDAAAWDRVQAVNARAPFLLSRRAAPLLRSSRRRPGEPAVIVNVSDLSAINVWTGFAHHSVAKSGLLHLTRVAALELAPEVRVNAVVPGAILPPPGVDPESDSWRRRGEKVPLGRTGDPAEVGAAVVFLVENDFLTGVIVPVDGGEHLVSAR